MGWGVHRKCLCLSSESGFGYTAGRFLVPSVTRDGGNHPDSFRYSGDRVP